MSIKSSLAIRRFGCTAYEPIWQAMIDFTKNRNAATQDELWVCEHFPVYTLGQAGKTEHLLRENGIPLIKVDRGGQITYHGPGQVVVYVMLDLLRRGLKVHELVFRIEAAIISLLNGFDIQALRRDNAPGVYVRQNGELAKIAQLGIRVRKNGCYHGLSLNVDMDLAPFSAINPCGYVGLAVTQTRDLGIALSSEQMAEALLPHLVGVLEQDG